MSGRMGPAQWLLIFFFVNSFAETLQSVAMLYAVYGVTHDATAVGLINAAAYLPSVVVGIAFQRFADRGRPDRQLSVTNWVLFAGSSALVAVWSSTHAGGPVVTAFLVVQVSLGLVKMVNKACVGRFVRDGFEPGRASTLLQSATSLTLVGGLLGGTAAGVLLVAGAVDACFALAAIAYLVSLLAVRNVRVKVGTGANVAENETPLGVGDLGGVKATTTRRTVLWLVLGFSAPSSGALPYISTLLVPLAASLAPRSGGLYSVLTIAVTLGGFLSGLALSRGRLTMPVVLQYALVGTALLSAALAFAGSIPLVTLLVFLAAFVVTGHVISMQVLTNQAPDADEVGRFVVLRNVVAGAAKGVFALVAGIAVQHGGLDAAWLWLGAVLGGSAVLWRLLPQRELVLRTADVH